MWKFNFIWAWGWGKFADTTQYGPFAVIDCNDSNYKRQSYVFNTLGVGFDRIEFWNHISYHLRLSLFSITWTKYGLRIVK